MTKTETVEEAMTLLKKYRKQQINVARGIADELIAERGTATTGDVFKVMTDRGLIDDRVPKYWLGAVFRHSGYKWTGQTTTGIGHDILARVWTI